MISVYQEINVFYFYVNLLTCFEFDFLKNNIIVS